VYITQREPTLEEQLSGELPLTQFGRACKKLGIEILPASSPQAKGRVERKHGVYQDRWVKELRLAGIRDTEGANQSLRGFTESLNARFAVEPRSSADFHRPAPQGMDLRNVFVLEEAWTVGNDWVVRYKNRFFQIVSQLNLPPARRKVMVQEHLDGSIHIVYRDREVQKSRSYPGSPWLLIKSNKTLNQRGNMCLLQIIPGEDTASNLNAPAKHYRYEVTRGHF